MSGVEPRAVQRPLAPGTLDVDESMALRWSTALRYAPAGGALYGAAAAAARWAPSAATSNGDSGCATGTHSLLPAPTDTLSRVAANGPEFGLRRRSSARSAADFVASW